MSGSWPTESTFCSGAEVCGGGRASPSLGPCVTGPLAETPPQGPPTSPTRPHVSLGAAYVLGTTPTPPPGPGHAPLDSMITPHPTCAQAGLWPRRKLPESRGQAFLLPAVPAPGPGLDLAPCATRSCWQSHLERPPPRWPSRNGGSTSWTVRFPVWPRVHEDRSLGTGGQSKLSRRIGTVPGNCS